MAAANDDGLVARERQLDELRERRTTLDAVRAKRAEERAWRPEDQPARPALSIAEHERVIEADRHAFEAWQALPIPATIDERLMGDQARVRAFEAGVAEAERRSAKARRLEHALRQRAAHREQQARWPRRAPLTIRPRRARSGCEGRRRAGVARAHRAHAPPNNSGDDPPGEPEPEGVAGGALAPLPLADSSIRRISASMNRVGVVILR
ncbi:MAG: hypothetical protein ACLP1Q_21470 [Solirubrobacteraceae bacterium]